MLIVTKKGKALRIQEENFRTMGKDAKGVKGINIEEGDEVADVSFVETMPHNIFFTTKNGMVLRTSASLFPVKLRGGKGINVMNLDDDDEIVSVKVNYIAGI
jgi:DNA gyrase subunit A